MDCEDDVVADQWYFDINDNTIKEVRKPQIEQVGSQPISTGSQTL
jgi:hypothetical protein